MRLLDYINDTEKDEKTQAAIWLLFGLGMGGIGLALLLLKLFPESNPWLIFGICLFPMILLGAIYAVVAVTGICMLIIQTWKDVRERGGSATDALVVCLVITVGIAAVLWLIILADRSRPPI